MTELTDWLALVHCRGVGPATIHKLLQAFKTPQNILSASHGKLAQTGLSVKKINALTAVDPTGIEQDLRWCEESADRHIVPYDSAHYPAMLKQISDPPLVLYIRGDLEVLRTPQLAIVGSRKPSSSAASHATRIAGQLCHYGLTVCSGLASGIDACAHRGSIESGGLTVAVTATGLDRVYPAAHQSLAHEIANSGAIVSEFPIGTNPLPAYFPRRNRIISGLCYGTLVVEAALKSGTLTTASHATDQSREVFAIPGSIDNPQTRGCHALIRNGATLVETVEDILVQLAPLLPSSIDFENPTPSVPASNHSFDRQESGPASTDQETVKARTDHRQATAATNSQRQPVATPEIKNATKPDPGLSTEKQKVLSAFDYTPLSLDAIVETTGLDVVTVTNLAFDLELDGAIVAVAGGKYIKSATTD